MTMNDEPTLFPLAPVIYSLSDQIKEVEREIRLRESVYPKWIRAGTMTQHDAGYHLGRMRSVLKTLREVADESKSVETR